MTAAHKRQVRLAETFSTVHLAWKTRPNDFHGKNHVVV